MGQAASRYRRLARQFTSAIAAVPAELWARPPPGPGRRPRDVLTHVLEDHRAGLELVGLTIAEWPGTDADRLSAWQRTRSRMQRALDDPAVAGAECTAFFGRTTFASWVDVVLCGHLLVHTWDVARVAGIEDRLDPSDVVQVLVDARAFTW